MYLKPLSKQLVLLFLFVLSASFSMAQCTSCTITISGASSTSYTLSSGQRLCITSTGTYTGNITLNGGSVCNQGTISVNGISFNSGSIQNQGTLNMSGPLTINNGSFVNKGNLKASELRINSGSSFLNEAAGNVNISGLVDANSSFTNHGQMAVAGNFNVNSTATQLNTGTLQISGNMNINRNFTNNGSIELKGNVAVNSNATFTNGPGAEFNVSGNYTNNGTTINNGEIYIDRNFTNNGNGQFINNNRVVVLNNFTNNGTINGASSTCNPFVVYGSEVVQNGSGSIFNTDFCAPQYPGSNFKTNTGTIGSGVTFCNCNTVNPLPVTLKSFDLSCAPDGVLLEWVTGSELNSDFFVVQRSQDLSDWEDIGQVSAAGFSNADLYYSFHDPRAESEPVYYRLAQFDFDGSTEVFPPVAIICSKANALTSIRVYPNPVIDLLQVEFNEIPTGGAVRVDIRNIHGMRVLSRSLSDFDLSGFTLDVSSLGAGAYALSISTDKSTLAGYKFVKL